MVYSVIPSGSLDDKNVSAPNWTKPMRWTYIDVGCLAKVSPLGGSLWMNELVIVIEAVPTIGAVQLYRVFGRHGETIFPYYVLDVQSHQNGSDRW